MHVWVLDCRRHVKTRRPTTARKLQTCSFREPYFHEKTQRKKTRAKKKRATTHNNTPQHTTTTLNNTQQHDTTPRCDHITTLANTNILFNLFISSCSSCDSSPCLTNSPLIHYAADLSVTTTSKPSSCVSPASKESTMSGFPEGGGPHCDPGRSCHKSRPKSPENSQTFI